MKLLIVILLLFNLNTYARANDSDSRTSGSINWLEKVKFRDSTNCEFEVFKDTGNKDTGNKEDKSTKVNLCKLRNQKYSPWSPEKEQLITRSFLDLNNDRLKFIYDSLFDSPRADLSIFFIDTGTEHAGALTYNDHKIIFLHPEFFNSKLQHANLPEVSHIILHEIMHLYSHAFAGDDFFNGKIWLQLRKITDWLHPKGLNSLINTRDWALASNLRHDLLKSSQFDEALELDFTFSRTKGFPSLYSFLNVREFYAELGAFLYHDPEVQFLLSPELYKWALTSGLGPLIQKVDSPVVSPPIADFPELSELQNRSIAKKNQYPFVGLISLNSRPLCTVFILKHGVIATARHCFYNSEQNDFITKFPQTRTEAESQPVSGRRVAYLNIEFRNLEAPITIGGMSIYNVVRDDFENDWAFIYYDASLTKEKIVLPEWKLPNWENDIHSINLLTMGYPLPEKIQRMELLSSQFGKFLNRNGPLEDVLPDYKGTFLSVSLPGWYGASGSPILSPAGDNQFYIWGLLSHTFELDKSGEVRADKTFKDFWGPATQSAISPTYLVNDLLR